MPINEYGVDPEVLRRLHGGTLVNPFPDARRLSPDNAAKGLKLGRETGMDPAWAAENIKPLQEDRDLDQWNKLLKESPKTAKFIAESPAIAATSLDDMDNLSGIEQVFGALKNTGRAAVSGLRSASAGAVGIARMPFDIGTALVDPFVGTILPENPLALGAAWLADYQKGISGRAKAEMPKADSLLGSGYYSGIASLSRNLAAIPMAFLPGGQKAALGTMVAPVGGEAFGEARDQGVSIPRSLSYAGSQATAEYFFEKIPLVKLMGDLKAGTPFLKTLASNVIREVPGEQATTILQDLNSWAVLPENAEKPFSEYLAERPDAAAQTLIATLVGTGGQVTVMEGISKAVGYAEKRASKAQRAEEQTKAIEQLNKLAASSKVLQRDAETFQSFVAAATEDGPVDTVYVDGRMLMQSGMAPKLAEISPAVRDQLDRAIAARKIPDGLAGQPRRDGIRPQDRDRDHRDLRRRRVLQWHRALCRRGLCAGVRPVRRRRRVYGRRLRRGGRGVQSQAGRRLPGVFLRLRGGLRRQSLRR